MKIGVDGASFDLRKLILEVHYDQAHEMNGMRDRSGLRFWAVTEGRCRGAIASGCCPSRIRLRGSRRVYRRGDRT